MRGPSYLGLAIALAGGACAKAGGAVDIDAPPGTRDGPRPIDAPVDMCPSSATCQAAMDLGSVSGDTGTGMKMASGFQAAWFKIRVTEDDNSVIGTKLKLTTRLTSPASANYDVFVYVNTGSDVIECATPSGTTNTNGATDEVKLSWGEGTVANGSDDGRTVSIEVRPISGSCAAGMPWQLVLLGDT